MTGFGGRVGAGHIYFLLPLFWLALSIVGLIAYLNNSAHVAERDFNQRANAIGNRFSELEQGMKSVLDGFSSMIEVMPTSDKPGRVMLARYAAEMRRVYPQIHMLLLAERIPREELGAFEQRESRVMGRSFRVRTFGFGRSRSWQPLADRETYCPVTMVEPANAATDSLLGLDIQSSDQQRLALLASMGSGHAVTSRPFELPSGALGYVVIRPVENKPSYFATIVVRADSLASALGLRDEGDLDIVIRDGDPPNGGSEVLYRQVNTSRNLGGLWDNWLPTFSREISGAEGDRDRYVIQVSKQMRWQDLDLPAMVGTGVAQLAVLVLLVKLAIEHTNRDRERRQHESRLAYMASHDSLTGLPNRSLLMDRLEQAILRAQREPGRLALLFLDIDRFKAVNDTYGHDAGDRFLMAMAETIRETVRAQDTVARLAGDEFVVLLEEMGARPEVEQVVGKIRSKLMDSACRGYRELGVGVSIGVATYPENGTDAMTLLRYADTHMYGEKRGGLATALMI